MSLGNHRADYSKEAPRAPFRLRHPAQQSGGSCRRRKQVLRPWQAASSTSRGAADASIMSAPFRAPMHRRADVSVVAGRAAEFQAPAPVIFTDERFLLDRAAGAA